MQFKTVGVVIPIYNVEKYLKECLDSVINQTYTNLEIILVNDGSTDENSLNIAKEYTLKDKRITLFDKKNGGHSSAKNVGIEYFSGEYKLKNKTQTIKENSLIEFNIEGNNPYEIYTVYKSYKAFNDEQDLTNFIYPIIDYIIFLDSDDYWELNCIEECVSRMDGVDVVWFDFKPLIENNFKKKFSTEMEIYGYTQEKIITPKEWLQRTKELDNYLFWFAWQGMINFYFLRSIKLYFINMLIHEDHHFGIALFASSRLIYVYPQKKYIYTVRKNSISNQKKYNIQKSSYLYPMYIDFDKNFLKLKKYQMYMNWVLTSICLMNFFKQDEKNTIYKESEEIFFPNLLDKSITILYTNKDPLSLLDKLLLLKDYFIKYKLSGAESIKNSLEYRFGQVCLYNYKNIFHLIKNILNAIKEYKLEQSLYEERIQKINFISFIQDDERINCKDIKKIKNHYSYKIGSILLKFIQFINCKVK
ncbi:TPA: glycosyltransferase family 2 protein [Campylobacter jejuni]